MIVNQAKPAHRKPPLRDQGSSDLDPAKLSVTLRELALRAHQLVRASGGSGPGTDSLEEELTEVHAQIVRLQRNLGSHQLDDLGTYVAALRERVEECLV
jgi:hypothetical protein